MPSVRENNEAIETGLPVDYVPGGNAVLTFPHLVS